MQNINNTSFSRDEIERQSQFSVDSNCSTRSGRSNITPKSAVKSNYNNREKESSVVKQNGKNIQIQSLQSFNQEQNKNHNIFPMNDDTWYGLLRIISILIIIQLMFLLVFSQLEYAEIDIDKTEILNQNQEIDLKNTDLQLFKEYEDYHINFGNENKYNVIKQDELYEFAFRYNSFISRDLNLSSFIIKHQFFYFQKQFNIYIQLKKKNKPIKLINSIEINQIINKKQDQDNNGLIFNRFQLLSKRYNFIENLEINGKMFDLSCQKTSHYEFDTYTLQKVNLNLSEKNDFKIKLLCKSNCIIPNIKLYGQQSENVN